MTSRPGAPERPALVVALAIGGAALLPGSACGQLPCVPADGSDGQPWVHHSRVLESFPTVIPAPTVLGSFMDRDGEYWLSLWRDELGYFGELSSPVLEVDSPSSRLRNTHWNSETRELRFVAAPGGVQMRVVGVLYEDRFVVSQISGEEVHDVVLLKQTAMAIYDWRSRAQFECAMKMWRRE
jgi:hypothetical protein